MYDVRGEPSSLFSFVNPSYFVHLSFVHLFYLLYNKIRSLFGLEEDTADIFAEDT